MSERGRSLSAEIATGSNTTVKSTAGTIYGLYAFGQTQGGSVRVEQSDLGASPDLNATGTDTLFRATAITSNGSNYFNLSPGIGFGKLVIAATSNTRVVAIYQ